jgi:transcriptional regulator GlxA family with amidase domain
MVDDMRIGLLLFEGVDLLDTGGPYEVFLTASRLEARDGRNATFEVVTISPSGEPVAAYGGLRLVPHAGIADCGPLDVLVVPGTIDVDAATGDRRLLDAIGQLADHAGVVASVCTGAFLLAAVGLLEDRAWTTHWEDIDLLARRLGPDRAVRDVRWVDAGQVVTAAGLSSGIAMALHLVDRLAGRDLAERTAHQIDYDWQPGPALAAHPDG